MTTNNRKYCCVKSCRNKVVENTDYCKNHRKLNYKYFRLIHHFTIKNPIWTNILKIILTIILPIIITLLIAKSYYSSPKEIAEEVDKGQESDTEQIISHIDSAYDNSSKYITKSIIDYLDIIPSIKSKYPNAYDNIVNSAIVAEDALNENNYPIADSIYNLLIQLHPDIPEFYNNYSYSLIEQFKFQKALKYQRKYVILSPDNPTAHSNLGSILHQLGQYEEATKELKIAINLESDIYKIKGHYFILGAIYCDAGKYESAIEYLLNSIFPENHENSSKINAFIYDRVGICYLDQDSFYLASEYFSKAIELDSTNAFVYHNLGICLEKQGKTNEAISHLKKALSIDINLPMTHDVLIRAYLANGYIQEVFYQLEIAYKIDTIYFDDNYFHNLFKIDTSKR